jgi:hypothetical protein
MTNTPPTTNQEPPPYPFAEAFPATDYYENNPYYTLADTDPRAWQREIDYIMRLSDKDMFKTLGVTIMNFQKVLAKYSACKWARIAKAKRKKKETKRHKLSPLIKWSEGDSSIKGKKGKYGIIYISTIGMATKKENRGKVKAHKLSPPINSLHSCGSQY